MAVVDQHHVGGTACRYFVTPQCNFVLTWQDHALLAGMDRGDTIFCIGRSQIVDHEVDVAAIEDGELPGRGIARPRSAKADADADRRKGESRATRLDQACGGGLAAVVPGAGIGDARADGGEIINRLDNARPAVVEGVVVGGREQVEADAGQMTHRIGVGAEVVCLGGRHEIVPVGDHRFEIGEIYVAVYLGRDGRERFLPGLKIAVLVAA